MSVIIKNVISIKNPVVIRQGIGPATTTTSTSTTSTSTTTTSTTTTTTGLYLGSYNNGEYSRSSSQGSSRL